MTITSITINAEASKSFQKYICSITAENLGQGDVEKLKDIAINEAVKGINQLVESTGTNTSEAPTVNTTVNQQYKPSSVYPVEHQTTPRGQSRQDVETAVFDGFTYKKCYNKEKREFFWAILNPDDLSKGAKKYQKV